MDNPSHIIGMDYSHTTITLDMGPNFSFNTSKMTFSELKFLFQLSDINILTIEELKPYTTQFYV